MRLLSSHGVVLAAVAAICVTASHSDSDATAALVTHPTAALNLPLAAPRYSLPIFNDRDSTLPPTPKRINRARARVTPARATRIRRAPAYGERSARAFQ